MSQIETINKEITTELANESVQRALIATTFKGLNAQSMRQALMEGMMRGFKFQDFLEKNVYAIPYSGSYSLVTSVDHARKVGMRSGVIGVSAPTYEMNGTDILSCTITVKRRIGNDVGEYTATVFFDEYNTKRNQWATKPRTMIAKVAEMHALRKACPEELAQSYSEEEMQKEPIEAQALDIDAYKAKLEATTTLEEMKAVWADMPIQAKTSLEAIKTELKKKYETA